MVMARARANTRAFSSETDSGDDASGVKLSFHQRERLKRGPTTAGAV